MKQRPSASNTSSVFRTARAVVATAALAYAGYAAPALALTPAGRWVFRPRVRVRPGGRIVLTFDDGPAPDSTPRVLDALDALGVHATFFLVGEQVRRSPDVARDVVARGHDIGCHGYHHRNHLSRGVVETRHDLARAGATIEDACGVAIRFFRPPYGVFNAASWSACAGLGWQRVLWSRWARDWEERATADSIARGSTNGLVDGEILLLHDADTYSARGCYQDLLGALPRIVGYARRHDLEPVRLSDAL